MCDGFDAVDDGVVVVVAEVDVVHPCVFEDVMEEGDDAEGLVVVAVVEVLGDVFGDANDVVDVLLFAVVTVLSVVCVECVENRL